MRLSDRTILCHRSPRSRNGKKQVDRLTDILLPRILWCALLCLQRDASRRGVERNVTGGTRGTLFSPLGWRGTPCCPSHPTLSYPCRISACSRIFCGLALSIASSKRCLRDLGDNGCLPFSERESAAWPTAALVFTYRHTATLLTSIERINAIRT